MPGGFYDNRMSKKDKNFTGKLLKNRNFINYIIEMRSDI